MGKGAAEESQVANPSSAVNTASNAVAKVYEAYRDADSETDGPAQTADDAELQAAYAELNAEMMNQMVEESQNSYEESKELFKLALRILTEHYELAAQATQTFTRG
jgi:hypothetical protein